MKMGRIPFEVKAVDVILVVISQGGDSGLINNETENWEGGYFCIFVGFFSFLRRNNLCHLEYGVFWHLETLASLDTALEFLSTQRNSCLSHLL